MKIRNLMATALVLAIAAHGTLAMAAFIVEPNGLASSNFSSPNGVPGNSVVGTAPGLTGVQSVFGNTGADPGWTFSYTPGVDADNYSPAAGTQLGDARIDPPDANPDGVTSELQLSSGLVGGESGIYRVFITWPASGNVDLAGSTVTVTSDISDIVLNPVDQNGTPDFGPTPSGQGGMNQWLLIGTVPLTAGNTYTVNMTANASTFVAQRVAGVMWEVIPEPSSLLMAGLGLLGIAGFRRRK